MDMFRRFLFRILHDERVINRLSESRPIRLFARICASIFMEGKAITQDPTLRSTPKAIKEAATGLSKEFIKTLKEAKEEIKEGIKRK